MDYSLLLIIESIFLNRRFQYLNLSSKKPIFNEKNDIKDLNQNNIILRTNTDG